MNLIYRKMEQVRHIEGASGVFEDTMRFASIMKSLEFHSRLVMTLIASSSFTRIIKKC